MHTVVHSNFFPLSGGIGFWIVISWWWVWYGLICMLIFVPYIILCSICFSLCGVVSWLNCCPCWQLDCEVGLLHGELCTVSMFWADYGITWQISGYPINRSPIKKPISCHHWPQSQKIKNVWVRLDELIISIVDYRYDRKETKTLIQSHISK